MPAARGRCAGLGFEQWAAAQWRAPARWRPPLGSIAVCPDGRIWRRARSPPVRTLGGVWRSAQLWQTPARGATVAHAVRGGDTGQYWAILCMWIIGRALPGRARRARTDAGRHHGSC